MSFAQSTNSSMTMAADSQPAQQPFSALQPNLAPPQIFDILPALHELLARIEHAPTSNTPSNDSDSDIGAHYQDQAPLEPKDLPTEVLAIKAKIRKALREVEKLPDMDVSVEEQEDEIRELEERIERQRKMVERFGEMGRVSGLG